MISKSEQADNLLLLSTIYAKGSKLNKVYKQISRKTYIEAYKKKEIGLIELINKLFQTKLTK